MRSRGLGCALLTIACGAQLACSQRSGPSDASRAASWGEEDDASALHADADVDASGGEDVVYQGPPVLRRDGRPIGFLRFVHIAPGAGRVRFIAHSADGYEPAHLEAVVEEGTTSEYLPTVNVPHRVRVVPEPSDAGVHSSADAGTGADLAQVLQTDVYNNAGCTVAFGGRARWLPRARRQDPEVRKLVRVVDIPRRDQRTAGMLRFMAGYAGAWPITIRDGAEVVYERLPFLTITGMRRMPPGPHAFALEAADGGAVASEPLRVELPGGEAHTLWIFGDRRRRSDQAPRALLTNDVPPRRIGPDFTGDTPIYR